MLIQFFTLCNTYSLTLSRAVLLFWFFTYLLLSLCSYSSVIHGSLTLPLLTHGLFGHGGDLQPGSVKELDFFPASRSQETVIWPCGFLSHYKVSISSISQFSFLFPSVTFLFSIIYPWNFPLSTAHSLIFVCVWLCKKQKLHYTLHKEEMGGQDRRSYCYLFWLIKLLSDHQINSKSAF